VLLAKAQGLRAMAILMNLSTESRGTDRELFSGAAGQHGRPRVLNGCRGRRNVLESGLSRMERVLSRKQFRDWRRVRTRGKSLGQRIGKWRE